MNDEKDEQLRLIAGQWREQAAKWRRYGDMVAERDESDRASGMIYARAAVMEGCAHELEKALDAY